MLDALEPLDPADVSRLAALHATTLPLSVLGRMGHATLVRYYRWVAESPREWMAIARGHAGVVGAAVVSFEPASVLRRFIAHAPLASAGALGACFVRDRAFRGEARAYLREQLTGDREPPAAPELMQIFVDAAQQNQSVGAALLDRVEIDLRQRGVNGYYARTLVKDNAPTLGFYERRGFTPVRTLSFCGAQYVLLTKLVQDEPR